MANEFKVKKGLIVEGSGGTILDIQGSVGQLFSITDSLTGDLFAVSDISGIPILNVNSSGAVDIDGDLSITDDVTLSNFGAGYLKTNVNGVVSNTATIPWATVSSTPTTISGYGITDALAIGTTATTAMAGDTAIPSATDILTLLSTNNIVDWTTDQGSTNIHSGNYSNTQLSNAEVISAIVASSSIDNADKGTIRSNIGAGTSSFDGAYSSLSGTPTLGTAATAATGDFATAAQGTTADGALQRTGGTVTGNLVVGDVDVASDRVVKVLADQSYKAGFEAYGDGQGTGYLYVGQSASYGGGISYNGDNSPGFIGGETADNITFFRRNADTNTEVFHYPYSGNDVTFNGKITASGSDSTNWNTAYGWGDHGLSAQDKVDIGNLSGTNTGDQDLSSYITSQRAISSTPTDGATTTAISSDWAFDNVKTAVPANAVFTDTVNTFDGAYSSLSGTPTIPSGNAIIDWTADQGNTNIHSGNYSNTQLSQEEVLGMLTAGANITITTDGEISATDTDTVYTHPTSAGNKHIPSGGAAGQFLKYSASGTATWATPSYTTNTNTTYSAGGGLDLTGTTFSVEPDLRDGITHVGKDTSNFIEFDSTEETITFIVGGNAVAVMESDGDLHIKGDVIAFSDIFNP